MNVGGISIFSVVFAILMIVPIAPFAIWYRNRNLQHAEPTVRSQIVMDTRSFAVRLWLAWTVGLIALGSWAVAEALGYPLPSVGLRFEITSVRFSFFDVIVMHYIALA